MSISLFCRRLLLCRLLLCRLLLWGVPLVAANNATAAAPISTQLSHLQQNIRVDAVVTSQHLGIGAFWSLEPESRGLVIEALFSPFGRQSEVRSGHQWQWVRGNTFGLSAYVGGVALFVPSPQINVGLGPNASIAAGWSWKYFEIFFAGHAAVEVFTQPLGIRYPLRMTFGVRGKWSGLSLQLFGTAGADLQTNLYPALRAHAGLALQWHFNKVVSNASNDEKPAERDDKRDDNRDADLDMTENDKANEDETASDDSDS